jgi:hypothetical protein
MNNVDELVFFFFWDMSKVWLALVWSRGSEIGQASVRYVPFLH